MKTIQQQILSKYKYPKNKPIFTTVNNNYTVYNGHNIDTNLNVTIKIMKNPNIQIGTYLKKIKQVKSENVIKIYELVIQQNILIMVTEQVTYGNFKQALDKYKYLEESDAIFMSKMLLNGHIDLLRADCNWFGTQQDIQFTQNGIKLSWNNSCGFNLVNPFPFMIQRFSIKNQDINSILPSPKSKTIEQIIKLSKQNASQISMNTHMKKKEKIVKKKGNQWMALKQYKNKNQYFDQLIYFGIHKQHGFIRMKVYDLGKISPNLLKLNKTKSSFTKILQTYNQANKTILISQYSNQGNVQSYITRLKNNGIKLKQDQIQFFIYSLIQPLKNVQESTLKSICMLNIRNIYIQNGIPKIGEPIPINQRINQVLRDRSDVPDFYHNQFKRDPTSKDPKYDTYSLGVLLYKLMYTEYPIFPNGKVHIPTTPTYNKRLKESVQIFLNQGGNLRDIEERIDISEKVKKQVQQNKSKLKLIVNQKNTQQNYDQNEKHESEQQPSQHEQTSSETENQNNDQNHDQQEQDLQQSCLESLSKKIQLPESKRISDQKRYDFVDQLQLSSFKNFRIWSKCVLVSILYVFLFYYKYIQNAVYLLATRSLLTPVNLNISSTNYKIITTDRYVFQQTYNRTGHNLAALKNMNCLIQDYQSIKYTNFIYDESDVWLSYALCGIGILILIITLKTIQFHQFDDINALFKRQQGKGHFNLSNWILSNLLWLNILAGHYFVFNYLFQTQTEPCIGHKNGFKWGSNDALFNNHEAWIAPYLVVFLLQFVCYISYMIIIGKNQQMSRKYNIIINPIVFFGIILTIFSLIIRIGVILDQYYYPAALTDKEMVIINMWKSTNISQNYGVLFGILPELLFIIQIIILIGVNWFYYSFVDKSQRLLLNNDNKLLDASLSALI